jgi:hypothetical protein
MSSARSMWMGLAVAALSFSAASAYTAAVVQHVVVAGATAPSTIQLNLQKYQAALVSATQQDAQIVTFPEFGLGMSTDACNSTLDKTPFCEQVRKPTAIPHTTHNNQRCIKLIADTLQGHDVSMPVGPEYDHSNSDPNLLLGCPIQYTHWHQHMRIHTLGQL